MKKKSADADSAMTDVDIAELSKAIIKKDNKIADLEQRLSRLEKRTKSNERFARTLARRPPVTFFPLSTLRISRAKKFTTKSNRSIPIINANQ